MSALAAVFAMSFSSLLVELALTRLYSAALYYHFAFLAISTALLGLGAGAVAAQLGREALARVPLSRLGAATGAVNAVAVVVMLRVILHTPVSLRLTSADLFGLAAIYAVSVVPFFLTGLTLAAAFSRAGDAVSRLYAADLVGGSAACLAVVPLLDSVGAPNAVLLAAAGMALASFCFDDAPVWRRPGLYLAAGLAAVAAANRSGALFDLVYAKGRLVPPAEFARWNALSRVEVLAWPDGSRSAVIDGDAATAIMSVDPGRFPGSLEQRRMMADVSALPNLLRPKGEFAIVGPGGGAEVLRAVGSGSPSVTGIEINPLIATTVMRERYGGFSRGLYGLPQVRIHVADGRSWLRATERRFDVVQMTLVDTWAATAAGAFALSENNLYTVEAFREYLERLKPDGLVAVTRWEFERPREALRVVSVAMEALRGLGVFDPARHIVVVSQGGLSAGGVPVVVLVKRSPFTASEEEAVLGHVARTAREIARLPWPGGRPPGALTPVHLPSGASGGGPFAALLASGDPSAFADGYEFDVSPVTDDAPFFFFTMKLGQLGAVWAKRGIDWKVNVGVAVLAVVLALSAAAVAAFLVLPVLLSARRKGGRAPPAGLLYFIAVGLGYILVEIALVQRFVLFLGHPTYAVSAVVFTMLLASGVGSALSGRRPPEPSRLRRTLVGIGAAVAAGLVALPAALNAAIGLPTPAKLAVAAGLIAPLAAAMGVPFPAGLRSFGGSREWAWAMNAAAGVLGSVLAIVVALSFGLQATLACGGAAYLAAAVLTRRLGEKVT